MILETIIGALVPVGIDGIKSLIGMFTGGVKPISVDIGTLFLPVAPEIQRIGIEAANIAFGFLFGTRIMANLKK